MEAVPSALTEDRRREDLVRLAEGWRPDVLVVGCGFTGAGIALDAATRGLSVAVVDRGDLADGTSRWSSKLVHGGLRYLVSGKVALARESAVERGIMMTRVAPHLTRPLTFVTPLNAGMPKSVGALAGAGYLAGHLLGVGRAGRGLLSRPGLVGPAAATALVPAVGRDGLMGAWVTTDGQLADDARMVVALARTAAAYGAAVLTYTAASRVRRDRVRLTDAATGQSFDARAARVVVAAGVWADRLDSRVVLRPSKGAHLVVDGAALGHPRAALTTAVPGHRSRFVFLLPQPDGRVYLGLTDDPVTGDLSWDPQVTLGERDFLLAAVNRVLRRPLTAADVIGGYAGYRPLVDTASGAVGTADLSREHVVIDDGDGPVTIVGGKLTTYRRMAADVVDRLTARRCVTDRQPLVGALPRARLGGVRARPWLVGRYGAEAVDLEQLIEDDPALGLPVVEGLPYLRAELAFAVRREGAMTPADLLDRRTRIGLVPADRDEALPVAEAILANLHDRGRSGL